MADDDRDAALGEGEAVFSAAANFSDGAVSAFDHIHVAHPGGTVSPEWARKGEEENRG